MSDSKISRVLALVEGFARMHDLWRSGWKPGTGNNARGRDPWKARGQLRRLIVQELKRDG